MPFELIRSLPNNNTSDGVELKVHAVVDNLIPHIVRITGHLCLQGIGLIRLESELRSIGEGWTFTPGEEKSRSTLKGHILGALVQAVNNYEDYSLPEMKQDRFYVRLTDIRPNDPNKIPSVLREFYKDSPEKALELLLKHPNDLLIPQSEAVRDAQKRTGHPLALLLPYAETDDQVTRVREYVGGEVDLVPMIESRKAVENMRSMSGILSFNLGLNDLTEDVLGKKRGDGGYDQLDPRVLSYIKKAKEYADEMGLGINVCSNIAENPMGLVALIGLGFRQISVPLVSAETAREIINKTDSIKASEAVDEILQLSESRSTSGEELRRRLKATLY